MAQESEIKQRVEILFDYLSQTEHGDYLGEPISQLEHSLQCAMLAKQSGADEETILGALLHDVGHFMSPTNQKISAPYQIAPKGINVGRKSHDLLGEDYLREFGFSEKVCQLVGGHVYSKRYLTAVDPSYHDQLSDASKASLKFQGGPMNTEEVDKAKQDPFINDKVALRKWDDLAKDPDVQAPTLDNYLDMAVKNILLTS